MPHLDLHPIVELEKQLAANHTPSDMVWRSRGTTHVGRVRHINEDAFFDSSSAGLWAVADGMGGHSRGDYASKAVVNAFKKFSRHDQLSANIQAIEADLESVNETCRSAFRGKRIGTTVALMFEYGEQCFFVWAGDTRIYRLREGRLTLMTQDHSVAQEKCARGELSPEEAATHKSAHVLTRAIGVHQTLRLDMRHCAAQAEDRYLICSDGLYNHLTFNDIEAFLAQPCGLQELLDSLMASALDGGGRDNITAVVIEATA